MTGFTRANEMQEGILTNDPSVRLHSCEKGTDCNTMATGNVVFITPIVTHVSSTVDLAEIGIGGGAGDLEQLEEVMVSPEEAREILAE